MSAILRAASRSRRGWSGARAGALALAVLLPLSGCDMDVVNPAQIADEDLNTPVGVPGIVLGVISDYGFGIAEGGGGGTLVAGAMLTDEMSNSGSWIGLIGLSYGEDRDDWVESQLRWGYPARARWVANRAYDRIAELVPNPAADPNLAVVRLYGGFANRVLGDNFCDAVRDGGPREPFHVYFQEAEKHFTDAIALATAAYAAGDTVGVRPQERMQHVITAAHAGRAQVRMMLAGLGIPGYTWAQALADAAAVPTDYIHWQQFSGLGRNTNNWTTWSFSTTSTEATVWGTPFSEWGQDFALPAAQRTGDARVVYEALNQKGRDNRRPFWRQRKFTSNANSVPNVRGTEMRLLEAEAALHAGAWETAVDRINEVRTFRNESFTTANQLPMVSAGGATEAWHLLMRERGIEMWLEGRRLADLRRWEVSPGRAMVPFQVVRRPGDDPDPENDPWVSVYDVAQMCIQVSRNEKLSNPNW